MKILWFCENILHHFHKQPIATPYEMWLGYNAGFNLFPGYPQPRNPYLWGTAKWEWWKAGWLQGMGELTREKRNYIEAFLLPLPASASLKDPWFSGAVKEYWTKRMGQLKEAGCLTATEIRSFEGAIK
jgi:hypothetical protein